MNSFVLVISFLFLTFSFSFFCFGETSSKSQSQEIENLEITSQGSLKTQGIAGGEVDASTIFRICERQIL